MFYSTSLDLQSPTNVADLPVMEGRGLPNRIRQWREERGFTLEKLAEMVGTTNQQISRLERGERKLTTEWLERIAPHLRCKPSDLLRDTGSVISTEERLLLKRFRDLSASDKDTVARMVTALAAAQREDDGPAN